MHYAVGRNGWAAVEVFKDRNDILTGVKLSSSARATPVFELYDATTKVLLMRTTESGRLKDTTVFNLVRRPAAKTARGDTKTFPGYMVRVRCL